MHWGHATSKDLFHWTHLPVFLHPEQIRGYRADVTTNTNLRIIHDAGIIEVSAVARLASYPEPFAPLCNASSIVNPSKCDPPAHVVFKGLCRIPAGPSKAGCSGVRHGPGEIVRVPIDSRPVLGEAGEDSRRHGSQAGCHHARTDFR